MTISIDLTDLTTIHVIPFAEGGPIDTHVDARSDYAEQFWLPTIGPSALWLLRHFAQRFDVEPSGFSADIKATSLALGIRSGTGRNATFTRTLHRLVSFGLGSTMDHATIAIRSRLPLLHGGQVKRLPKSTQARHASCLRARATEQRESRRRAEQVAHTLLDLGDSPELVRRQLSAWGVDSAVAGSAVDTVCTARQRLAAPRNAHEHVWPEPPPTRTPRITERIG